MQRLEITVDVSPWHESAQLIETRLIEPPIAVGLHVALQRSRSSVRIGRETIVSTHTRIGAAACCAALAASSAAGAVYFDGIFSPINWHSAFSGVNGNGGAFTAGQELAGGNLDEHFAVYHDLNDAPNNEQSGIAVLHTFSAYTHDPAADGAIVKMHLRIDTKRDDQSQRVRFAIIQAGAIYVSDNDHSFGASSLPMGWQTTTYVDVLAEDFQRRLPDHSADPGSHPDFSAAGAPMVFGFETSNSTGIGFGGYDTRVLFDNFTIFAITTPACAGDINGDGLTNAADFTILAGNFGSAVLPNTDGDLNGDGLVNAADFVILAGDFGCVA